MPALMYQFQDCWSWSYGEDNLFLPGAVVGEWIVIIKELLWKIYLW
jgi:hypothetical protein